MTHIVIKELTIPIPCEIKLVVTKDGVELTNVSGSEGSPELLVDPKQWGLSD